MQYLDQEFELGIPIGNLLKGVSQEVKDRLRLLHVLGAQQTYRRFVILGMGRTGSNYLATSLRSLTGWKVFGELFNDTDQKSILWECRGRVSTPHQLKVRAREPLRFMKEFVFGPKPAGVRAVGFKLFYYHARDGVAQDVWNYLADESIHVIHLRRRNLLEMHLSMMDATQTNEWSLVASNRAHSRPVHHVDPAECIAAFEDVTRWGAEARARFIDQPVLDLFYEDLVERYQECMDTVQRFLGFVPEPTSSNLVKQNDRTLEERISNYDELARELTDAGWGNFLDQKPASIAVGAQKPIVPEFRHRA